MSELLAKIRKGTLDATDLLVALRLIFDAGDTDESGDLTGYQLLNAVTLYNKIEGSGKVCEGVRV